MQMLTNSHQMHRMKKDVSLAIHSIPGNDLTIRRTFYYCVCTDSYCRVWLLSSYGINRVSEMEGHFMMLNWKENNSLCVNSSLIMITVTTTGASNIYIVLPRASHCLYINSILIILWLGICYLCSTNEEIEAKKQLRNSAKVTQYVQGQDSNWRHVALGIEVLMTTLVQTVHLLQTAIGKIWTSYSQARKPATEVGCYHPFDPDHDENLVDHFCVAGGRARLPWGIASWCFEGRRQFPKAP